MDRKKQREAIAIICGYAEEEPECVDHKLISDFCRDAGVVIEIEAYIHTSGPWAQEAYANSLTEVVAKANSNANFTFAIASASPCQKAEAFLRTMGKWEDK